MLTYVNDVIVFMENLSTHWYWMDWVLWKFQDNGLCLQLSKCEFEKDSVIYLGLKLSHNWLEHDPGKAVAIQNLPQPRTSESCNTTMDQKSKPSVEVHPKLLSMD